MSEKATLILQLKDLFSGKAKKAANALGGFNKKVKQSDRALGRFTDASGRMREANGRFVEGQKQAGRAFGMTIGKLYMGAQAFRVASGAALGFVSAISETAGFDNRMELAFERLTHDGAKTYTHVKRLAEQYGLEVDDTAKSYKNFLALQFKPAMADKMIAMGADMQALGSDAEEVKGIFRALGQIKAKGRVQAEEMLQLSERGVSSELIVDELAKARGITPDQEGRTKILGLQQQGKITADEFFAAFELAINKKLGQSSVGESGKQFADTTIDGMSGRLKAKATNIWKELVKGATPTIVETMGGLSKKFDQFAMSPAGQKTFAMIGGMVQGIASAFAFLVPLAVDFFGAMIEGGAETLGPLSGLFGESGSVFGGMATLLPELGRLFGNVLGIAVFLLGGAIVAGSAVLGVLSGMAQGVREFGSWFVSSIGNAILWWDDFKARVVAFDFLGWGKQLGMDIVNGMISGIKSLVGAAGSAISELGANVIGKAKSVLGIASPSKEFQALGEYTGDGFMLGLDSSMAPANDTIPQFVSDSETGVGSTIPEFMTDSARSAGRGDFGGLRGGGGGINITIKVTVNTGATDTGTIGDMVAERVGDAMEGLFLQLSDEAAA
jgi:tape measure domain-containing protein